MRQTIQQKQKEYLSDKSQLAEILSAGAEKLKPQASSTLKRAEEKIGVGLNV